MQRCNFISVTSAAAVAGKLLVAGGLLCVGLGAAALGAALTVIKQSRNACAAHLVWGSGCWHVTSATARALQLCGAACCLLSHTPHMASCLHVVRRT
jgi:hypothetical protein